MKISVCTATHKHKKYLPTYVQGIVDQLTDFPDLEVNIVVDEETKADGDVTWYTLLNLIPKGFYKNFNIVINDSNLGGPESTTKAYQMATGDWIAALEGDDYYKPGKIKKTMDFILEDDLDGACTEVSAILPDGTFVEHAWKNIGFHIPKIIDFDNLVNSNKIYTCSFIHHRKWLDIVPTPVQFATEFEHLGDYPKVLYMTHKGAKIGYLDEPLSVYRDSIGIQKKDWNKTVHLDHKVRQWARQGCVWNV